MKPGLILWVRCPDHLPTDQRPMCPWCLVANDLNNRQIMEMAQNGIPQ